MSPFFIFYIIGCLIFSDLSKVASLRPNHKNRELNLAVNRLLNSYAV